MNNATMTEPPRVGDWWMCPVCGDAGIVVGFRGVFPFCPNHQSVDAIPLTLTEADWLKCRNVDALIDMVVNLPGLHKETVAAAQLMRREGPSNLTESAIRCIFGNPFRPFVLDPAWLTWNDGTVKRLASEPCPECEGIGVIVGDGVPPEEIDFHDWPVCPRCDTEAIVPRLDSLLLLADALEESGCDRDDVLLHLREPQAHWPGCFVLRAILDPVRTGRAGSLTVNGQTFQVTDWQVDWDTEADDVFGPPDAAEPDHEVHRRPSYLQRQDYQPPPPRGRAYTADDRRAFKKRVKKRRAKKK